MPVNQFGEEGVEYLAECGGLLGPWHVAAVLDHRGAVSAQNAGPDTSSDETFLHASADGVNATAQAQRLVPAGAVTTTHIGTGHTAPARLSADI